jgi:hypothetical protein
MDLSQIFAATEWTLFPWQIPIARTMTRLLSQTPRGKSGPTEVIIFDIHHLQVTTGVPYERLQGYLMITGLQGCLIQVTAGVPYGEVSHERGTPAAIFDIHHLQVTAGVGLGGFL